MTRRTATRGSWRTRAEALPAATASSSARRRRVARPGRRRSPSGAVPGPSAGRPAGRFGGGAGEGAEGGDHLLAERERLGRVAQDLSEEGIAGSGAMVARADRAAARDASSAVRRRARSARRSCSSRSRKVLASWIPVSTLRAFWASRAAAVATSRARSRRLGGRLRPALLDPLLAGLQERGLAGKAGAVCWPAMNCGQLALGPLGPVAGDVVDEPVEAALPDSRRGGAGREGTVPRRRREPRWRRRPRRGGRDRSGRGVEPAQAASSRNWSLRAIRATWIRCVSSAGADWRRSSKGRDDAGSGWRPSASAAQRRTSGSASSRPLRTRSRQGPGSVGRSLRTRWA